MSASCNLARELEGIVDAMIEADNDPMDIIACCKDAIIVSMMEHGKKDTTSPTPTGKGVTEL